MTESAGSYAYSQFDEKNQELERLKRQAGVAQQLERRILTRCGLGQGMEVIDLGCGPGIVSCELARMAAPGNVIGIDLNPELLEQARSTAERQEIVNLSFQLGDLYQLDLADASYDFIYARFLFQHLRDVAKALREILRILKPGGIVAITDVDDGWLTLYPEPEHFRSFVERAAKGQAEHGGDRYIGRKLGHYLDGAGFSDVCVEVETVTSAQLGMQNFLDITTGFKHAQLMGEDKEIGAMEKAHIYGLLDAPNAWGFTGVFVATGRKPA